LSEEQNKQLAETPLPIRHNVRLAPGTYIITTALRDRTTGRTSIARRGITLPVATSGPHLSSIVLAQQTEQLPADYPAAQLARDVLAFGQIVEGQGKAGTERLDLLRRSYLLKFVLRR